MIGRQGFPELLQGPVAKRSIPLLDFVGGYGCGRIRREVRRACRHRRDHVEQNEFALAGFSQRQNEWESFLRAPAKIGCEQNRLETWCGLRNGTMGVWTDRQNRAGSAAQHFLGHGAESELRKAATAVCTDDQQVAS